MAALCCHRVTRMVHVASKLQAREGRRGHHYPAFGTRRFKSGVATAQAARLSTTAIHSGTTIRVVEPGGSNPLRPDHFQHQQTSHRIACG